MDHRRIAATIGELVEVGHFCAVQAGHAVQDRSARRWLAIGLVIALQGACVCALSAYETADETDILDAESARAVRAWHEAGRPEMDTPVRKIAPVALLLRRVRSEDYLTDDDRLTFYARKMKSLQRLIDLRNTAVHIAGRTDELTPDQFAHGAHAACDAIEHLLLVHPAFPRNDFEAALALIGVSLERVRKTLG